MKSLLNQWWTQRAEDMEKVSAGKLNPMVWEAIPELRSVLLKHHRSNELNDTAGQPIPSADGRRERWAQHFKDTWNVHSTVDPGAWTHLPQRDVEVSLDSPPTDEESIEARAKMSRGKAAGEDGVPPDLLKELDEENMELLHKILRDCWGRPPDTWRDEMIIPLFKGGKKQKTNPDNYRGIALLSVVGKLFTRIIATRLAQWAEECNLLPEEQCGYRTHRGTLDLITILQCTQDIFKDAQSELHVAFVDLRKAFDSVNREALYAVLSKLGVPPIMLQTIKGLHNGLQAKVFAEGAFSDPFEVSTGVRQGCCLAPILFALFFATVINTWKPEAESQVQLRTRLDSNLHRSYTGGEYKGVHNMDNIIDFALIDAEFADDLILFGESGHSLAQSVIDLYLHLEKWGLQMSDKTELLTLGGSDPVRIVLGQVGGADPIIIGAADDTSKGGRLAGPGNFKYVGSTFSSNYECYREIELRTNSGWAAFAKFKDCVWNVKQLDIKVKGKIWLAAVLPAVLYGLGARALAPRHIHKLQYFQDSCARRILRISRQAQHTGSISNAELRSRLGWPSMEQIYITEVLRHVGHIMRMPNHRLPKMCLFAWHPKRETLPASGGGVHQRYHHTVLWALKARSIPTKI